jgi:hypothetical protein
MQISEREIELGNGGPTFAGQFQVKPENRSWIEDLT